VWGPGAFADSPDVRRGRLEPVVDTHVAPSVELDADLLEADPGRVGRPPRRRRGCRLPSIRCSPAAVRTRTVTSFSRSTVHTEHLGPDKTFDTFGTHNPLHFTGDVGILLAEKLRGHVWMTVTRTAERRVRLTEFRDRQ